MQELDETITKSRIIVDSLHACESGDLSIPLQKGSINKEIILELALVLAQNIKVRTSNSDITFFKSVGIAIQDIATGYAILQQMKKLKKGIEAKF